MNNNYLWTWDNFHPFMWTPDNTCGFIVGVLVMAFILGFTKNWKISRKK